ncbi:MAG: hypothetical protein FWG02_04365 [Holophagaceae bacterium]|nr:hypothetical protein [Holophagaceae bacterium]
MRNIHAIMLAVPAVLVGQANEKPTIEQILDKHYSAMGGLEKLIEVKTTRATFKMQGGPVSVLGVIESRQPGSVRAEAEIMGQKKIEMINEDGGWDLSYSKPTAMSKKDVDEGRFTINLFVSPFVNYSEKGSKVEYVGTADRGKTYKVRLTTAGGNKILYFIDISSYLIARVESSDTNARFSNYKMVSGINVPHEFEEPTPGAPGSMKITLQKMEINPVIDDSRFESPKK